jgi:hypothetical protein
MVGSWFTRKLHLDNVERRHTGPLSHGETECAPPALPAVIRWAALSWLSRNLTTTRAIKNAPHGEVVADVLELMLDSRSHEQEIACLEWFPFAVVKQDTPPSDDDVNFVLLVR